MLVGHFLILQEFAMRLHKLLELLPLSSQLDIKHGAFFGILRVLFRNIFALRKTIRRAVRCRVENTVFFGKIHKMPKERGSKKLFPASSRDRIPACHINAQTTNFVLRYIMKV